MPSQTNSVMRNNVRPIVIGLLIGLGAAYLAPEGRKARREHPVKQTPATSVSQAPIQDSSWRFVVVPVVSMFCFWCSCMAGVVFIPKRFVIALERYDVSKGEARSTFIMATCVTVVIVALIYESSFCWEIERALKAYQGHARTFEYYPRYLCISFRTSSIQDRNLPEIRDGDLPSIVEIALRADRQHYWNSIVLDLSHTNITDDGLPFLEQLPDRIGISLVGTNVTDEGVELLLRKKPK